MRNGNVLKDIPIFTQTYIQTRVFWLVWLRWLIILSSIAVLTLNKFFGNFHSFPVEPLVVVTFILLASNIGFIGLYFVLQGKHISTKTFVFSYYVQALIDYFCIFWIVYNYGFLGFNLSILLIPHIIIATMIFEKPSQSVALFVTSLGLLGFLIYRNQEAFIPFLTPLGLRDYLFEWSTIFFIFLSAIFFLIYYITRNLIAEFRHLQKRVTYFKTFDVNHPRKLSNRRLG